MPRFRRSYLVAIVAVPVAAFAAAHGCSNPESFESVCDWIAYPGNCLREFHNDMLVYGTDPQKNPWGDCRTYPNPGADGGIPTEVNPVAATIPKKLGTPNGDFFKRAMLDTCILSEGGTVMVNPPIDPTMWPPPLLSAPVTYTFTFMTAFGTTCGTASYTSPHGFSITVNGTGGSPSGAGGSGGSSSASSSGTVNVNQALGCGVDPADTEDGGVHVFSGTYSSTIAPGADLFNITCPTGESHTLNLNEVEGPTSADGQPFSACPGLTTNVPFASLQVYTGGIDQPGAMSFAIVYPNACSPLKSSADLPSDGIAGVKAAGPPATVVYFNCSIPAQPENCVDGAQDGTETDVDCGGPYLPSKCNQGNCPARCLVGQHCLIDCDCGDGLTCGVDPMSGMKTCVAPGTGTGGSTSSTGTGAPNACPAIYTANQNNTGAGGGCPLIIPTTGAGGTGGAGGSGAGVGGA